MALQRSHNEHLYPLSPHPQSHELHGKGLACPAGAEDRHVGVFVNAGIKDVHDDQGVIVLVDPQQDTIVVAHLIAGKGVAAGRPQGQHVPLGSLIQPPLQGYQRKGGQKSLLLAEGTGLNIHILAEQQLLHLGHLPLQVVHIVRRDGNEQI